MLPSFDRSCLADWLQWLEALHPVAMDLGLTRVKQVADNMGLSQFDCPVITIGGTNGKGSTVALLENIYRHAGYRVGAYTSPHLLHYNERIRIEGSDCSDAAIVHAFEQIEAARGDVSLTYFEYGTLAALFLLKQAQLDVVLLEVGLGGRLDAVNIIDPILAIITSVDLDHTEWLGTTREAIGYEKAGIFRKNTPAICGDFDTPESIRNQAALLNAPLYCQGKDFTFQTTSENWSWELCHASESYSWDRCHASESWHPVKLITFLPQLPLPILAPQNAATALMAVHCLQTQLPVDLAAIKAGVATATVLGRFQHISQQPQVIVDVAHNPAAARLLAQRLQQEPISGKTYAVFSALQDKDVVEISTGLSGQITEWHIAPLETARGSALPKLKQDLIAGGCAKINEYPTILAAYEQAILQCGPNDRIIVFGSFFTATAVFNATLRR